MLPEPALVGNGEETRGRVLRLVEGEDLLSIYQQEQAWGLLSSLDIHDCRPETIRDKEAVARYAVELCRVIEVTPYGPAQVVHFGRGAVEGYSMVQLIETSLISGHFANATNRAFIDIFSCCYYDPRRAAEFTVDFFGGQSFSIHCVLRK